VALTIDYQFDIDAPQETVWQVIADMDKYAEWNPFVVGCRSTLEPGTPIWMNVQLRPGHTKKQKETIFKHEPQRLLSYGIGLPLGLMASNREHRLEALDGGRCRYHSHFYLCGPLALLVSLLMSSDLRKGFLGMSEGIKKRAEQLAV